VSKSFSRHRLKKESPARKPIFLRCFLGGILFLFLVFLIPVFRIAFGPFGGFFWHIGSFWNSTNIILIQNEAELRPSGGFLSAVGVLEIKNGIPSITVHDSYSITDPPEEIRAPQAIEEIFSADPRYFGFVFRDANFSPDFPQNAQQIIKFLQYDERFARKKIDSVIAVNFAAVQDLLRIFGPINRFDSDTLFRSLQRKTKDIDLHSLQELETRKDTLGELAQRLVQKIGFFGLPKALESIARSASKKDVQMWFLDPVVQKIPRSKGWDGALPLEDFYSVNIANLGAKKSDRYILKRYLSDISIAWDGKMTEKFSGQFFHRGGENLFSGPGYYFLRIYRPYGTTIVQNADGWSQKTLVGQYEEFSKMIYLESLETKTESATFHLPESWTIGDRRFFWWAQSGSMDDLMITVRHPGDASFTVKGCDKNYHHENVLFCFVSLESDADIAIRMLPDELPPIIEDIFFANTREISVRFSEPVSDQISESLVEISCPEKKFSASRIFRNDEYPRDARIVLSENADLNGEFCALHWKGVLDEYQNTTDIKMTLPFRES
jgi:hypothetical protein